MREAREKPLLPPFWRGLRGWGGQQAHLSLCCGGHAGKASATPPEASGESEEQRPTSPISWRGDAEGAGCTGGRASGKKQQRLLAGE